MDVARSKELRGIFSPTFDAKSFGLQVPKLDHSMSRRLKELKGGEVIEGGDEGEHIGEPSVQAVGRGQAASYLWGKLSCDPHLKEFVDGRCRYLGSPAALLLEPNRFSPKECGSLFGRSFLKQMVKEASEDKKLRNLNRDERTPGLVR
ncbi:hypothetical protein GHT06_020294 [Daphnia sinensis]|uniref:Uncharacterized protein n=1 Tax=Daphnia sinensis TaxID=1820382 RepID=A0AAD5LCA9_9CRUS|nr:hypothetical protein GHT06_020294 [Daphnia sinensis]